MKSETHYRRAEKAMIVSLLSFMAAVLSFMVWVDAPASTFLFLVPTYVAIALAELWVVRLSRRRRAEWEQLYRYFMAPFN